MSKQAGFFFHHSHSVSVLFFQSKFLHADIRSKPTTKHVVNLWSVPAFETFYFRISLSHLIGKKAF